MKTRIFFLISLLACAGFIACKTAKKSTSSTATRPNPTPKPTTRPSLPAGLALEEQKMANGKPVLIQFVKSDKLMPVLEQAKKEKKGVFIDFHAAWCMPCRIIEENVFTNAGSAADINKKFISLKVDIDQSSGADIAALYDVQALPTLLFLDPNGIELTRQVGAVGNVDFQKLTAVAISKQ